ncbi:MAG: MBOAT family protein [Muribaculaceae bacterium]|nr:MBOAT family protein [Muribaculaceae bacterium]
MLFNSLGFVVFFPIVCLLYWLLPNRLRNYFLLVASYYFYMNWEPVYALLILFSTIVTWACGNKISQTEKGKRKGYLVLCITLNFAILFIYKYLNFATDSIFSFLSYLGMRMQVPKFNLLLPVGISFYTFQAVGYTIDVYRRTIEPERYFFTYALFVSFFPQLVAGPIERAKNLLPQFHAYHVFHGENAVEGMKFMLWGYFMKLCIAGNVAPYVDAVFNNLPNHYGTSVLLASFFFTFQIFCDFGGYSLIAIGTARCLGFNLMQNFNRPYLATSLKEFWRRWHISLSSWFMDYVYIPLGGSRCSKYKHMRNLMITFVVSGIWHGANWTFVCWGAYHGLLVCEHEIRVRYLHIKGSVKPIMKIINIFITFILAMVGWILFRANSISDALLAFKTILFRHGPLFNGEGKPEILLPLLLIAILMFKEIKDELGWKIHLMHNKNVWVSALSTALLIIVIGLCAQFESGQFIYFQF